MENSQTYRKEREYLESRGLFKIFFNFEVVLCLLRLIRERTKIEKSGV